MHKKNPKTAIIDYLTRLYEWKRQNDVLNKELQNTFSRKYKSPK